MEISDWLLVSHKHRPHQHYDAHIRLITVLPKSQGIPNHSTVCLKSVVPSYCFNFLSKKISKKLLELSPKMMANSSVRRVSPLHHQSSLPSRSVLAFFNRSISTISIFSGETPSPRLVSVRSQTPGSDHGSAPQRSVSFHESTTSNSSSSVIDFLTLCRQLKTTKRKGWVNHGIRGAESIADHMYRMAIMALIAADLPGLNRERCIKIALVHDIAEAIVGDITPSDGVPKEEKSRREQAALNEMCEILGGGMRAEEIKELWAEYENNSSLEANLVKDFDKVEMILQALEYEIEHGKVLDEFFISTAGKFQTQIGKSWAAEIISRRKYLSAKKLR